MKEGLAALTKLVKVVMAYRPERGAKKGKPAKAATKTVALKRASKGRVAP